ncbi:netrin receptor UNC5D-like [Arapaima gigas]
MNAGKFSLFGVQKMERKAATGAFPEGRYFCLSALLVLALCSTPATPKVGFHFITIGEFNSEAYGELLKE